MLTKMSAPALARWLAISASPNFESILYETMPDGGCVFGARLVDDPHAHWRTFAINPDGGKAYPLS